MLKKYTRTVLYRLIIIHGIFSLLHFLSVNLGHPVYRLLKNFPFGLQLFILFALDFMSYFVAGFILSILTDAKKELDYVVSYASILFGLILLAIFGIMYFLSIEFYKPDLMVVYAIVNPWYGTFMFKLGGEKMYSLWWTLSAIIPSLGYYLGVKYRLFKEGI